MVATFRRGMKMTMVEDIKQGELRPETTDTDTDCCIFLQTLVSALHSQDTEARAWPTSLLGGWEERVGFCAP